MCNTNTTRNMDGSKVRYFRKLKRWSQAVLARRAGISQSMVSKMERRGFQPKVHIAERIARLLGVKLEQLGDAGLVYAT